MSTDRLAQIAEKYGIIPGRSRIEKTAHHPAGMWQARILAMKNDTLYLLMSSEVGRDRIQWNLTSTLEQIDNGHLRIVN